MTSEELLKAAALNKASHDFVVFTEQMKTVLNNSETSVATIDEIISKMRDFSHWLDLCNRPTTELSPGAESIRTSDDFVVRMRELMTQPATPEIDLKALREGIMALGRYRYLRKEGV